MDIGKFKTDPKKELQGVWIPIGEGAELLIARWGNDAASKTYERLTAPTEVKQALRLGTITEAKALEIQVETIASGILLNWKGLTENGKTLEYNPDNCRRLLALKDFRAAVENLSKTQEYFREEVQAQSVENLKKT